MKIINIYVAPNMVEFAILNTFDVNTHPLKAFKIKEILWNLPIISWVKCNSYGAVHGSSDFASCGCVFTVYQTNFLGCYASNIVFSLIFMLS